jgi:multidrug efflux pump subunit AcrA (membrane-fusion protein)
MTTKRWVVAAAMLVVVAVVIWKTLGRDGTDAESPSRTEAGSTVTAAVARVLRSNLGNTLRIAGEFKPFQDVDIHAKVAGYIRSINVDVGDHVKQGQTIAVLEVPELAAQL